MTDKERILIELSKNGVGAEKLTKRGGIWTLKNTYFYTHGESSSETAMKILKILPRVEVVSVKDSWLNFPKRSEIVVKFKIKGGV